MGLYLREGCYRSLKSFISSCWKKSMINLLVVTRVFEGRWTFWDVTIISLNMLLKSANILAIIMLISEVSHPETK